MTTDVTGFIAQPVRAGQVGTVADEHDTGLQRRWPDALQQRPHLLDPAARLAQQLFATRAQIPQPAPTSQLRRQPSDDHGVFLIGLVEGPSSLRRP